MRAVNQSRRRDPRPRLIRPALPSAVLGAIVLIAAVPLVGTEWFYLVSFAVSILALITAVIALQHRKWWWAAVLVPIAVVWNPVIPVTLADEQWMAAHYLGGLVFLVVGTLVRVPDDA